MDFELEVHGCAGSAAFLDADGIFHGTSGYQLNSPETQILLDIGFGTNAALGPEGRRQIAALLISHRHSDHVGDLVNLGQDLQYPKDEDGGPLPPFDGRIIVYGPAGVREELDYITRDKGYPRPISDIFEFRTLNSEEPISVGDFLVTPFQVDHGYINGIGMEAYAFRVQRGNTVFVYSGDTGEAAPGVPSPGLLKAAQGADVALFNAFYLRSGELYPGLHMSGDSAGRTAERAGAGGLFLTHHHPSVRNPRRIVREANEVFSGPVTSVQQGYTYSVRSSNQLTHSPNPLTLGAQVPSRFGRPPAPPGRPPTGKPFAS
jgi:ribonuclease BN (tRNA processing enzyme)